MRIDPGRPIGSVRPVERPFRTRRTGIAIVTFYAEAKPGGPLDITISVNGDQVAAGQVPISAPLLFSANDCLDIGTALGSPVSLDYYDRAPFPFDGTIHNVNARYHN